MNLMGTSIHGAGKHDSTVTRMYSDNYTGDGTQNRSIPHFLGKDPKLVIVVGLDNAVMKMTYVNNTTTGFYSTAGGLTRVTRTGWDAANFYIGALGGGEDNGNGWTYRFIAMG